MVPVRSDRLRRFEILLLALGAVSASLLLAASARKELGYLVDGSLSTLHAGIYAMKLLLMEAALLAPFVVLAMLGRALLRETTRSGYRFAGLGISAAALAGVLAMLLLSLMPTDYEKTVNTLAGDVVPALVLLAVCALLYGGLIGLAQRRRNQPLRADEPDSRRQSH